ncbi:MAG: hypothetical protein M3Q29_12650 [Chloroflexota bacterium]|nr:hypothetical protein [Chloroflexota bacterium]
MGTESSSQQVGWIWASERITLYLIRHAQTMWNRDYLESIVLPLLGVSLVRARCARYPHTP